MLPDSGFFDYLLDSYDPAWSPNGEQIAFVSGTGNEYDFNRETSIYVINEDGTNLKKIVDNGREPSWSPDGKKLAYQGLDGYYVITIDSGEIYKLMDEGTTLSWR